jgi:hypothetical protein
MQTSDDIETQNAERNAFFSESEWDRVHVVHL